MAEPLLRVHGIDVYYGHVQALRGVSLEVYPGELVALVGANGAGKTTTLRTISGLLRPIVGEVWLDGARIDRLAPEKIVEAGLAHLPEGRGIFPTLTVSENLQMGFYIKRGDKAGYKEALDQAIELFPRLGERMGQAAGTLSGGEQQMLALARAMLAKPRVLLIDELSLGLAPVVVQMLFERLGEINRQGTTVLLVEQFVNLALQVADRAYVLAKGAVALEGSAADLARDSDLVHASYLGSHGVETAVQHKTAPRKPAARERPEPRSEPRPSAPARPKASKTVKPRAGKPATARTPTSRKPTAAKPAPRRSRRTTTKV